MAIYQYRCAECGPFDVARPIGTAGAAEPCAGCGGEASRVFTAPHLARTSRPLARALHAQEAGAEEPAVVRRVPGARRGPAAPPADPRHALLPRP
ncbi:zinc ribbon domain-containing protein [Actinomadura sp. KC345]|uniref:FmdB family zinc ribbon protein n=1 Tax=Actinomadura sp. KC345 TaxID=2530371 RepID=UPI00104D04A6|nr:zinc ribbon domain-containing protein [Actinomadura sp. KC345]TDC47385.1 zinc ribbon domain-containing protein [Actinomadura sp. KC345]